MIPPFLIRPLIYAGVIGIALMAAYFKGREHGSEKYFSLVADLSKTTFVIQKATAKANTDRKAEKAREGTIFQGLQLRLANEIPKITPVAGCAIPDADRVFLTDSIVEAANRALGMRGGSTTPPDEIKPTPSDGLGTGDSKAIRDSSEQLPVSD